MHLYQPSWQVIRRMGISLSMISIIGLIGSMIKGFGGGASLFKRWEVPGYIYVISILVVLLLLILMISLLANPEGHLKVEVKKEYLAIHTLFGRQKVINGPFLPIKKRFDLWSENDSQNWVVELKNIKGENCLLLIPNNKYSDLEILIAND